MMSVGVVESDGAGLLPYSSFSIHHFPKAVSVVRKKLRDAGESAPAHQAVARLLPDMVHVAK